MSSAARFRSFSEFWPFYLGEHRRRGTRVLHFIGTSLALVLIVIALAARSGLPLLLALLVAYAFAWIGHFLVEKNRPATFRHPLWSFAADWKMWAMTLMGTIDAEISRAARARK